MAWLAIPLSVLFICITICIVKFISYKANDKKNEREMEFKEKTIDIADIQSKRAHEFNMSLVKKSGVKVGTLRQENYDQIQNVVNVLEAVKLDKENAPTNNNEIINDVKEVTDCIDEIYGAANKIIPISTRKGD